MMKDKEKAILTYGAYTDGNKVWLPSKDYNAVFYKIMNNNDGAKYFATLKDLANHNAWLIEQVIFFEDQLFFFSRCAYQVWVMDVKTGNINPIIYSLPLDVNIRNVIINKNEAWIFPSVFEFPIKIFNLNEKKVTNEINWHEYTGNAISDQSSITKADIYLDNIYLATRKKNNINICKIDCINKKISFNQLLNIKFISCLTVCKDGIWALVYSDDNRICLNCYNLNSYNIKNSVVFQSIESWPINTNYSSMPFIKMISYKNTLFLFPALHYNIIFFNTESKKEGKIEYPYEFQFTNNMEETTFFELCVIGNLAYIYPCSQRYILILNMETMDINVEEIYCNMDEFIASCRNCKNLLLEKSEMGLDEFSKCVTKSIFNEFDEKTTIGSNIYSFIKSRLKP